MKKISVFLLSLIFILSAGVIHAETTMDRMVKKIITGKRSNDDKVYLIEKWVSKNIKYRSDKKQFNMAERWTLPMETLQRRKGDCEDGAILLVDLAVTAGVPEERLRVYAPIATESGLHASVAYQRESDDTWVWVEWTVKEAQNGGPVDRRADIKNIFAFIPFGPYLEVTSLNPFNMEWHMDEEMKARAQKIKKSNK